MEFRMFVKGVTADIAKNEIRLVFVGRLTYDAMAEAKKLAFFATSESPAVDVSVNPLQKIMDMELTTKDDDDEEES